jgi:hypothetical protein
MLKPIAQPLCTRALNACHNLQVQLLEWLCDPAVNAADVIYANLILRVTTAIEADWLWAFLHRDSEKRLLLERAQILADMPVPQKNALRSWIRAVIKLEKQFEPHPPSWPDPNTDPAIAKARDALKELMVAFYEKGLKSANGVPYLPDGTPTTGVGVTYAQFLQDFRDTHRLNPNPYAREVCVLCGGPLGQTPEVDHWIAKAGFPILSVCGDNLLPICGDCNSTTNKGEKPTFTSGGGAFVEWFHPYLRPANGTIGMDYCLTELAISAKGSSPFDAPKVSNLDKLLNLASRWTREFKAEYAARQDKIRKLIERGRISCTQHDIQHYVQQEQDALVPSQPHYEVHRLLLSAMLEQSRLASWETEFNLT